MAETKVENLVCQECSANVRPGALFCYNCGAPYTADLAVETAEEEVDGSPYKTGNLTRSNGNKNKNQNAPTAQHAGTAELPIVKPPATPFDEALTEKKTEESAAAEEIKKSPVQEAARSKKAVASRQKSRLPEESRVEIVWEEPENSTNFWFFVVSIILVILAAAIIMAALYLK